MLSYYAVYNSRQIGDDYHRLVLNLETDQSKSAYYFSYFLDSMVQLILILIAIFIFGYLSQKIAQIAIDIKTKKLVSDLDRDVERKFFLYLRPFNTTGNVNFESKPVSLPFAYSSFEHNVYSIDLEFNLRKSLRFFAPLIGLGSPGEHIGIGRYKTSNENWKPVVEMLMHRAQGIFFIPGSQAGTIWEMQKIFSDNILLEKTVWIIPVSKDNMVELDWSKVQEKFSDTDLLLSRAPSAPCAFTLTRHLSKITKSQQIDLGKTHSRRKLQEATGFIYRGARTYLHIKRAITLFAYLGFAILVIRACS